VQKRHFLLPGKLIITVGTDDVLDSAVHIITRRLCNLRGSKLRHSNLHHMGKWKKPHDTVDRVAPGCCPGGGRRE